LAKSAGDPGLSARFYMSLGTLDKKKLRHGRYAACHDTTPTGSTRAVAPL